MVVNAITNEKDSCHWQISLFKTRLGRCNDQLSLLLIITWMRLASMCQSKANMLQLETVGMEIVEKEMILHRKKNHYLMYKP